MAVLIADAHFKQALAFTRSLGCRGIAVDLVAESSYSPAFYSKFCRRYFQCPSRKEKETFISINLK